LGCTKKNELNHLSFKVSKDTMLDSLKTATELLNKMDYGNGATCFVVDGKLHHTRKEFGFTIVEMPKENASITPIIEPLDQSNSIRLFNLMHFMLQNGFIDGMGKRADGVFYFGYKQINLNPHNRYNDNRSIIYTIEDKDTLAKISDPQTILDRYKNILLVGPSTYNEPKLPTDEKSRKERAKDFLKKKENEGKKLKAQ
jgi:hypothetical protein